MIMNLYIKLTLYDYSTTFLSLLIVLSQNLSIFNRAPTGWLTVT